MNGIIFCMNNHFPLGDINPIKYFYLVAAVTGLLFSLITPAENISILWHMFIWQLQAFIPISFLIAAHAIFLKLRFFARFRQWQQLTLSGLTGSLLFSPCALLIDIYIVGEGLTQNLMFELADEAAAVTPPVTIFWLLVNLPWMFGYKYQREDRTAENKTDSCADFTKESLPRFLSLTPINNIADIVSMSAQLHYLEILTVNDKFLILYSLATAIEEMPKGIGIQTHRSHWVAFNHIKKVNKEGRQGEVVTLAETKVPISRSKLNEAFSQFHALKK